MGLHLHSFIRELFRRIINFIRGLVNYVYVDFTFEKTFCSHNRECDYVFKSVELDLYLHLMTGNYRYIFP